LWLDIAWLIGGRVQRLTKQSKQIPNVDSITPHFTQCTSLPWQHGSMWLDRGTSMIRTDIGIGPIGIEYWYQQDPIIEGIGY